MCTNKIIIYGFHSHVWAVCR
uniref:Uncharacterized protein n=1 Tax=Arundo donax TaxID=35708 RepID=A0A0A8YP92_ARUDO